LPVCGQRSQAFLRARTTRSPADADQALAKLRETIGRGHLNPGYLPKALVALGRLDDAFAYAMAAPANAPQYGWFFEPGTEAARRDPRFWPLAAHAGLIRYWRTRGVWPDFCGEPGLPFDCAAAAAKASPP
jgi:hypothetical protein